MDNAERYHFADFTRANYRALLQKARSRYVFRRYTDYGIDEQFVLWRHDLDFSVHAAVKLARIEAEEGVVATYFLYPHSEFYNLLEADPVARVREILALGHDIGLHFDPHFYSIRDEASLEVRISEEAELLRWIFGVPVRAFSFHKTDAFILSCRKANYFGLVNCYSDYFQTSVGYCSDSNGFWRHRRLEDVLTRGEDERLQVLTHPEFWTQTAMSPRARIMRLIKGRAQKTERFYDNLLAELGRENIDEG